MAFLVIQENDLISELRLISKFMTSQPRKQKLTIQKTNRNQTMKLIQFGRKINYRPLFVF